MNSAPTELSLIDVQLAFAHWRSQRAAREQPSQHLRSLAIALLDNHVPFSICKALGINSVALKHWPLESTKREPIEFVSLNEQHQCSSASTDHQWPTVAV